MKGAPATGTVHGMPASHEYLDLCARILRSRFAQLVINEGLKAREFHIPVHLALGHEAIAEAVGAAMRESDKLVCSHRNIHYQLARGAELVELLEEFKLSEKGLARGKGGSMNLSNPRDSIVYTSSILGNNLCVAAGIALSKRIRRDDGIVFVATGDGAIEEGAFYETLENARHMDLPLMILVEDNHWSLATRVEERRKPIDLNKLASGLGTRCTTLEGNDPFRYFKALSAARDRVLAQRIPEVVEIKLTTLGDWRLPTDEFPAGKFINYHAGPAPKVSLGQGPVLCPDASDPVFLIRESVGNAEFERLVESARGLFSDFLTT